MLMHHARVTTQRDKGKLEDSRRWVRIYMYVLYTIFAATHCLRWLTLQVFNVRTLV